MSKITKQKPSEVVQSFLSSLDGIKKDYEEKYRISFEEIHQKRSHLYEKVATSTNDTDLQDVVDELKSIRNYTDSMKGIISKLVTAKDFMQFLYNELKTLEESIEKEGNDEAS